MNEKVLRDQVLILCDLLWEARRALMSGAVSVKDTLDLVDRIDGAIGEDERLK